MDAQRPSLLAADVGTSSLKAVLYDDAGRALRVAVRRYDYLTPQPGWAEGDPCAWWQAFCEATQELAADVAGLDRLDAIAFTGQMHSAVLLDAAGEPLDPTILWLDRRADRETAELQAELGLPPYELNSTYSLPKLAWLRRHRPDVLDRARALLWPKDYLRYRLTGQIATDLTECGGAALLDWSTGDWARERLPLAGLNPDILPPILPAAAFAAPPRPDVAAELGLNPDARVIVGVGDVAALIGGAPPRPGRVVCSMGSSSMIFMALAPEQQAADAAGRLYVYPFLPPYRLAGGVSSTTGAALVWLWQQFRGPAGASFEEAAAAALEVAPGCDGLVFLPYLAGERSPYWSDDIRGGFHGLRLSHDARHATRAVMEGIAFSLRHLLDIYREMGLPVTELALAGGGAKTPGLAQLVADTCGLDAAIYTEEETVTRVLYALAQQALGRQDLVSALERTFPAPTRLTHQPAHAAAYDAAYARYRRFSDFAAREACRAR
ncbi:MAG: FGGY family carbohydrate kinase [Anaerolineae bacterium]|nr:FGGY family carbohydrate kinase [Anaerolineae bacterium]